jgi:cytochrome b561
MASQGYTPAQIALHWAVVVLFAVQVASGDAISAAFETLRETGTFAFALGIAAHVGAGLGVLAFALWRLALRARHGAPPPPPGTRAQHLAAAGVHLALYAVMILMPVSGAVAWFGGVEAAAEAHEAMKPAALLLILVHVGAAVWHQVVLKDGLMARMARPRR